MKVEAYVKSAATILTAYDGKVPFAAFLKDYFRKEKKFGSRDRRTVSQFCYAYFRLGNLYRNLAAEERIYKAMELQEAGSLTNEEALQLFPLHRHLSPEIDALTFARSQLQQPDLFLRLRPGHEEAVKQKLAAATIPFTVCAPDCLALPNGARVDTVLSMNAEAVVQDRNSQQVLSGLQERLAPDAKFTLWDCCAASGGKSILAIDRFPRVQLTASDIRDSILNNLRTRFRDAGIRNYRAFKDDVGASTFSFAHDFDVVLCDAPCSGSGTWGRTPEQLQYFEEAQIAHYASLQRRIAVNALQQVKKGGYFLYTTCSVFSAENEDNVAFLQKASGLTLLSARYFKGYDQKADTLFAALFQL
ncbi:methyltransferase domain-containing protein [Flaviaesturariibacter aridisoli]|uniref:Methyltransferase domain-containing protein n=1 Tax=Flaviaesturariibacter aridisoli TaxID=2545761 RepID=A0A4V2WMA1_9BACT|nr:methyltransferase domain-containing protein [Flaviaesturariibacter aridisoli]TCZ67336.1 methyltransferase domain-containing protein [Flaviaesturariibacter aridisoli]